MIRHIPIDQVDPQLRAWIDAVVAGETIVIDADGETQIQLVPITPPRRRLQIGSARGKITLADDFDAPLDDFQEYM